MIFCIPKRVGSFSISDYFLNNLDEEGANSWLLGPVHRTKENILLTRKTLKVMVTRHPLERIASTFTHLFQTGLEDEWLFLCNKGGPGCKQTTNAYLAREIISKLRPGVSPSHHLPDLSFSEFVTFLLDTEDQFAELRISRKLSRNC